MYPVMYKRVEKKSALCAHHTYLYKYTLYIHTEPLLFSHIVTVS